VHEKTVQELYFGFKEKIIYFFKTKYIAYSFIEFKD